MELYINDEYGNYFDVADSLLSTAVGSNPVSPLALSFGSYKLDYSLTYFYCNREIFLDGNYDDDYWNDEYIKELEAELASIHNGVEDSYTLEQTIKRIFEAMGSYSNYLEYVK